MIVMEHFLSHPTMSTFACGADAIGRRNPRVQCNANNTTCAKCLDTQDHAMAYDSGVQSVGY